MKDQPTDPAMVSGLLLSAVKALSDAAKQMGKQAAAALEADDSHEWARQSKRVKTVLRVKSVLTALQETLDSEMALTPSSQSSSDKKQSSMSLDVCSANGPSSLTAASAANHRANDHDPHGLQARDAVTAQPTRPNDDEDFIPPKISVTGSKPVNVRIGGRHLAIHSWASLCKALLTDLLTRESPELLIEYAESSFPKMLSNSPSGMRQPKRIGSHLWCESNHNANHLWRFCKLMAWISTGRNDYVEVDLK